MFYEVFAETFSYRFFAIAICKKIGAACATQSVPGAGIPTQSVGTRGQEMSDRNDFSCDAEKLAKSFLL